MYGPSSYDREPLRHPSLQINCQEPFNAEPQPAALVASYITPVDMFYKRNHGPIPVVGDPTEYSLRITGLVPNPLSLTLSDLSFSSSNAPGTCKSRALKKHSVVATLMCAGNRRTEMSEIKKVKGIGWGLGAIGNGEWAGARLSDVLEIAGIPRYSSMTANGGKHVEFVSVDSCKEEKGGAYMASIPLFHATNPDADVLLAYEMNGEVITRDHGFPLRVVVPGVIGARSVKWLSSIGISLDECKGFFQQQDYKMFPPWVDWHNIVWSSRHPIMDFPVQCAICTPSDGSFIVRGSMVKISGYALSGGGRGIERVDVSLDGGRTWTEATWMQGSSPCTSDADERQQKWGWVLWELYTTLALPTDIIAKAVDSSSNIQPQSVADIWNLRGVLNNSWHQVHVDAAPNLPLITSTL